jgi:hypothetical protein
MGILFLKRVKKAKRAATCGNCKGPIIMGEGCLLATGDWLGQKMVCYPCSKKYFKEWHEGMDKLEKELDEKNKWTLEELSHRKLARNI